MSSFASDLRDAVQPDGMLKDTSKIDWPFDPDDSIPFPSHNPSGSHSSSSGGLTPAIVVASVQWTTRLSCPSQHVLDELEAAEAAGSASSASGVNRKCKAIKALPDQRSCKNVVHIVSNDDGDDKGENRTPSPPPTEPASDDYESLQAMANAENQVCSPPHCTIAFSH